MIAFHKALNLRCDYSQLKKLFKNNLKTIKYFRILANNLYVSSGHVIDDFDCTKIKSLPGNSGMVSYGPYINLPDGLYKVKLNCDFLIEGDSANNDEIKPVIFTFDIITDNAKFIWYVGSVTCEKELEFYIELLDAYKTEIRFFATGFPFSIDSIEFSLLYQPNSDLSGAYYYYQLGSKFVAAKKLDQAFLAYYKAAQLQSPSNSYYELIISYPSYDKFRSESLSYAHFCLEASQMTSIPLLPEEILKQIKWWEVGDIFAKNGWWIEASQGYQKALLKKPEISLAYQQQADSLAQKSKLDPHTDLKAKFFTALLTNPHSVEFYLILGKFLTTREKYAEAIYIYNTLFELINFESSILPIDIYYNFGYALAQKNQFISAIKCYKKGLDIDRSDLTICLHLADALSKNGEINLAIQYYKIALQNSSNNQANYSIYWGLANLFIHLGEFNEAKIYLEKIINAQDIDRYQKAIVLLASIFEKLGQFEKANTLYQQNRPHTIFQGHYQKTKDWAAGNPSAEYKEVEPRETDDFPNPYGFYSSFEFSANFVAIVPKGRYLQMGTKSIQAKTTVNFYCMDSEDKVLLDASNCNLIGDICLGIYAQPPKNLEGQVAIISGFSNMNYYHWLIDHLPKLGLIEKAGIDFNAVDKIIVSNYSNFQKETLDILGIPEHKILDTLQGYSHIQADRLIVVPSSTGFRRSSLDFLRYNLMPLVNLSKFRQIDRIYITRRLANGRKLINEEEVIDYLRKLNFFILDGELMSVEEKISLFSKARVVIGICGAGLANLAFCSPGTKVVEIFLPHMNIPGCLHYYYICRYLDLEYYLLKAETGLDSNYLRQIIYQSDHYEEAILNLNSLKELLASARIS